MDRLSGADWVALTLVIIGAINWGLIGLFNYNLVAALFGVDTALTDIIYVLIGLSGLWAIYTASKFSQLQTAR